MQDLDWLDVLDIAIELNDKFPEIDPQWISFPDLHKKVCNLDNFEGDPFTKGVGAGPRASPPAKARPPRALESNSAQKLAPV